MKEVGVSMADEAENTPRGEGEIIAAEAELL